MILLYNGKRMKVKYTPIVAEVVAVVVFSAANHLVCHFKKKFKFRVLHFFNPIFFI